MALVLNIILHMAKPDHGSETLVHLGDYEHCPQCARMGRVVWISSDGKVMGVQCSASHCLESKADLQGFFRPQSKPHKNSVFLVDIHPRKSTINES
jgi:hypothetical protein